jgi:hypothetical protein
MYAGICNPATDREIRASIKLGARTVGGTLRPHSTPAAGAVVITLSVCIPLVEDAQVAASARQPRQPSELRT